MSQTIRISRSFSQAIRLNEETNDLICRCIFLGYGPSAIVSCLTGLSDDKDLVIEMSDGMGYFPGCITLEVDRE